MLDLDGSNVIPSLGCKCCVPYVLDLQDRPSYNCHPCSQELSQGYFQPNVGGENIPTAQGELSDLAGDEPLFKALYQWCRLCPPSPLHDSCKHLNCPRFMPN